MLTGGRSAENVYAEWAKFPAFRRLSGASFFFGDERSVSTADPESNFGLAMRTLFSAGVPGDCTIHRMEADCEDIESAADRYEALLPPRIDCLLLGVGEDGHIASLFPHSTALRDSGRRIVPVTGPKYPHRRMTITPSVIRDARAIFVLAPGGAKADVLRVAESAPEDFAAVPARLVLRATWLLDAAYGEPA